MSSVFQITAVAFSTSFHGTDVLAVSEHGAPGRRPNTHTQFVGRQREDGLDTLPARAAEANRSTLIADIPFPALETSQPSGARARFERTFITAPSPDRTRTGLTRSAMNTLNEQSVRCPVPAALSASPQPRSAPR